MIKAMTAQAYARAIVVALLFALPVLPAPQRAAAALDAAQQEAANKLKAKGASVVPLAANDESLVINLAIVGKSAGDEDLAAIKTLPKVVQLNLGGTGVTDAGLANLAGLSTLTHLHLDRTQVTDAGLAHLKGLGNLTYLNLYNTAVTDAGLEHLKELKNLKRLYLWQTKVTDGGAGAIKAAVPGLVVNRGEEMAALLAKPAAPAPGAAGKPINTTCPVSGKPVDAQFTVAFEGKTVGFCCENCPKQFEKDPKKFAAKIKADAPGATPAPEKEDDKKAAASPPAESRPDEEGFIRTWLLLAPIPLPDGATGSEEIGKEQVAGEKDLKPRPGDKAKAGDKELTWKAIQAKEYYFDINEELPEPQSNVAGYAVAYLASDEERKDVHLLMGSNDQGRVYLNGKEVLKFESGRSIDKDQDKSDPLTLKKGVNVVVFKVINESNNWQGCVRFTDKDGKPVKDLKVMLSPEPVKLAAADAPAKPEAEKAADKKPAAAEFKPDDEGFIRAWLLLAPIPLPDGATAFEELDKEQVAGEKDLKPKAGDKAKAGDKELAWKAIQAKEYYFDINEELGEPLENVAGYAVCYLLAADEQKDVTLLMGSNDLGKIYLNGNEVVRFESERGIDKDQDKSDPLTLKKGVNVVVFKVINTTNNWQGCVRFTDKDGKPFKNLKVLLTPEPVKVAAEEKKPADKPEAQKAAEKKPAGKKPQEQKPAPVAVNLLKPANKAESWRFEQHEQGKGKMEPAEDAMVFTVTEADGTDWHVQAFQTPLDLKDGTEYVVTFKARAPEPRGIRVQAGIDEEDYHTIGLDEPIDLGKDWKDHELKFTAADTRANKNRFGFVLGGEEGAVHVKDLVLKPAGAVK